MATQFTLKLGRYWPWKTISSHLKACRNLFLSGKNSPSTHSSANGQILTRTFERKWLPNDRAIELLIRDWKLGTLNLAKIGTKISKREVWATCGFSHFSGWTEPIHWVFDRNFQKFWLNGSRPMGLRPFLIWDHQWYSSERSFTELVSNTALKKSLCR